MVDMFRVPVLMTCSSSVNNASKTAICAGGAGASELRLCRARRPFASRAVPRSYSLTRILL